MQLVVLGLSGYQLFSGCNPSALVPDLNYVNCEAVLSGLHVVAADELGFHHLNGSSFKLSNFFAI